MRKVTLILLLASVALFTACSSGVDFVVTNDSDQPIEVRYRVDEQPGDPIALAGNPCLINASLLRDGNGEWRLLAEGEYKVDREAGTLRARVMPGEALLITSLFDSEVVENSPPFLRVEELDITGVYGEIKLRGRQVSAAFIRERKGLYSITYK